MTEREQYPESNLCKVQYSCKNKKLIIFNGPPSSGKDEACKYITENANAVSSIVHITFKQKLTHLTQVIFGVTPEWWEPLYTESGKNIPRDELDGKSQRDALIFVSETIIKPTMGKEYFGKATIKDIVKALDNGHSAVISDGGFIEEMIAIDNEPRINKDDVLVVRCHREGYDFSGDSRSFVNAEDYGFDVIDIWNDGSLERYHSKLEYCFPVIMSDIVDYDAVGTPIYEPQATADFEAYLKYNEIKKSLILNHRSK